MIVLKASKNRVEIYMLTLEFKDISEIIKRRSYESTCRYIPNYILKVGALCGRF